VATGGNYSVRRISGTGGVVRGRRLAKVRGKGRALFRRRKWTRSKATRAKRGGCLGWEPEISFEELVRQMVAHDLDLAQQELTLVRAGHVVSPRGGAHG